MNWLKQSQNHLSDVKESYWRHGWFAVKWGFFLVWTGVVSILHGIFPFLFPFLAPKNVLKMKALMDERNEEERIQTALKRKY